MINLAESLDDSFNRLVTRLNFLESICLSNFLNLVYETDNIAVTYFSLICKFREMRWQDGGELFHCPVEALEGNLRLIDLNKALY